MTVKILQQQKQQRSESKVGVVTRITKQKLHGSTTKL